MFYTRRVFYTEDVIDRVDDGDEGWITTYLTEVVSVQVEGEDWEGEGHRQERLLQLLLGRR